MRKFLTIGGRVWASESTRPLLDHGAIDVPDRQMVCEGRICTPNAPSVESEAGESIEAMRDCSVPALTADARAKKEKMLMIVCLYELGQGWKECFC